MAEMLSPGVFVTEIDASTIVPTVSNSIGAFSGDFKQGPVGTFLLMTSVDDLVTYYGKPTNSNYNDFYQAYNFLQYGNKLLVSRASNVGGTNTPISGVNFVDYSLTNDVVELSDTSSLSVGDYISFGEEPLDFFKILQIDSNLVTLDREVDGLTNEIVNNYIACVNSIFEATSTAGTPIIDSDYIKVLSVIENASDFENKQDSLAFVNSNSKIKFIARNPGAWANDIQIAVATPDKFNATVPVYAFDGIALDDLFEYAPTGDEVGIVVMHNDEIVETYTVSFDETAKDYNNKSIYIETLINNNSSYIFVKDNTVNSADVKDYTFTDGNVIKLVLGTDSVIQADDLINAYSVFENKDELDIDIVIANELDDGASAVSLVSTRQDCIAFIGAKYDIVGKKAADATSTLITWRNSNNINNMFAVACANYKYQYDRYNDKNRLITSLAI